MTTPQALTGQHSTVALPFDPARIDGLSARLLTSHHENNYGGAVRNLNRVELELARSLEQPPFVVAALREKELQFRNSKLLHELYFENISPDSTRSASIDRALSEAYGSLGVWEQHLRQTALGLAGGSGWALLVYELDSGALRTVASTNHTQAPASAVPLLVLDMYEHSFHLDYGAAAARYVDAFVARVNWERVEQRWTRAIAAREALRGALR
ncbi:MAG: Fe-Mn family superoxide dismutase [Polyangiales bacterium]